jgi:sodium/potassium-transporting ATPase subunit alpha
VIGSATDEALLQFAAKKLKNIDKLNDLFPKVFEVPFSSDTKYHLSIHRKAHTEGGLTLHVKGAPEMIWKLCSKMLKNGKLENITEYDIKKFQETTAKMGEKGYRLISFAMLNLPGEKYPDNFRFSFEKKNFPMVRNDKKFINRTILPLLEWLAYLILLKMA